MTFDVDLNSLYANQSPFKEASLKRLKVKGKTGVTIPKTKGRKYYQTITSLPPYRLLTGDYVELPNGQYGEVHSIQRHGNDDYFIIKNPIGYFRHTLSEITFIHRGFVLGSYQAACNFTLDHGITDYGISPDLPLTSSNLTNVLLTNDEFKQRYLEEDWDSEFSYRRWFTHNVGWPIITKDFVDVLAVQLKGKRVADLGCGLGYLTYHLNEAGVNVTGYDNFEEKFRFKEYNYTGLYIDIVKENIDTLDLSEFDVVIISWPRTADAVLRNLKSGQEVIYIGEGYYGCTGSDKFHDLLETEFTEQETEYPLLRWDFINDRCVHYIKN